MHAGKPVLLLSTVLGLSVLLTSCQLFGGTNVTFINSTSFAIATIQFGPLAVSGPVNPSSQTASYTITPGQNALAAEGPGGAQTNSVLLTIVAGHSYTVTFNPAASFPQVTVTLVAVN